MYHRSLTLYSCLSSLVPFLPPHSDWQCTRVSSSGSTSVTKLALKNCRLCPLAGDKESGRIAWRAIDGNIPMTFGGVLLQNKGWVRIKVFPGRIWKKKSKEVGLGVALFSDRGGGSISSTVFWHRAKLATLRQPVEKNLPPNEEGFEQHVFVFLNSYHRTYNLFV